MWRKIGTGNDFRVVTEMHASVGDRIIIRGMSVGSPDRHGEIIEVRGRSGEPPYLVRFGDGHEALTYPGADCVIEPAAAGA
jgi:hypothetical protein